MMCVGMVCKKLRILAHESFTPSHATGGDRFTDRHALSASSKISSDCTGNHSLADAGVGAGDEQTRDGNRRDLHRCYFRFDLPKVGLGGGGGFNASYSASRS